MNERFKFRVWDSIDCEYIEDSDVIRLTQYGKFVFNNAANNTEPELNPKRFIFEQCTGLEDKNGKLIYDGDIVKTDNGNVYYIKWDEKTGSFREEDYNCKNAIYRAGHHLSLWKDSYCKSYEIVGNIHENPELVEV